ncbi:MAG: Gfo/Idh/MocA family oxidoreductase, partial [Bacteroidota bacterium]
MQKKTTTQPRRTFLKRSALATAGLGVLSTAQAYENILGANDRLNVAVIGVNGRGGGLLQAALKVKNVHLGYICDVDTRAYEKHVGKVKAQGIKGRAPKGVQDFRRVLEDKNIDAVIIATPDHWHAPMSLLAMQAGKHVYVEKPCGHNPQEGEMLIAAQEKYGKVLQMGNQQRSGPVTIEGIKKIHEGLIGRAYYGKAWYANSRGSIGRGKAAPVPDWLDYDLWQGPAPRTPYMDNYIHYNWHWFWRWGTGESCNNATHEVDICRWALQVDYPIKVSSAGGRYHFDDDWEFYDSQMVNYDFPDRKTITWEGYSCNGVPMYGRGRGALIRGTEGSMLLDRNGYIHYDRQGKVVAEVKEKEKSATTDIIGIGGLDAFHMSNFAAGIREGGELNSPIVEGHKSVLLCHM